jgi:hypothetical protein
MGRAGYRRGYGCAGGRVKPRTSTYQFTTYRLHQPEDEQRRWLLARKTERPSLPKKTVAPMHRSVVFRLAFEGIWV